MSMLDDPDRWSVPDEDHRFTLGIHPGDPGQFFGPSLDQDQLLSQRRQWLADNEQRYAAVIPEANDCLAEVESLATQWGYMPGQSNGTLMRRIVQLGQQLEPDFVLLAPSKSGLLHVVGGCVCFPSYWRLTDKIELSVEAVHAPVPGLNASLGAVINRYLAQMKPGGCSLRANWGMASRPDLNEHPDEGLYAWERPLSLERVWIRREDQALLSLPKSGGVLFGIRVVVRSLAQFAQSPTLVLRLVRGLQTMPAELIQYKGLEDIRDELIRLLKDRV